MTKRRWRESHDLGFWAGHGRQPAKKEKIRDKRKRCRKISNKQRRITRGG